MRIALNGSAPAPLRPARFAPIIQAMARREKPRAIFKRSARGGERILSRDGRAPARYPIEIAR
jgi:hypothetical protein